MKPILCTSDLWNIHVCFATESSTKCFEHLRSPLKKQEHDCDVKRSKIAKWNLNTGTYIRRNCLKLSGCSQRCSRSKMLAIISRAKFEQISITVRAKCEQITDRDRDLLAQCSRSMYIWFWAPLYLNDPYCMGYRSKLMKFSLSLTFEFCWQVMLWLSWVSDTKSNLFSAMVFSSVMNANKTTLLEAWKKGQKVILKYPNYRHTIWTARL